MCLHLTVGFCQGVLERGGGERGGGGGDVQLVVAVGAMLAVVRATTLVVLVVVTPPTVVRMTCLAPHRPRLDAIVAQPERRVVGGGGGAARHGNFRNGVGVGIVGGSGWPMVAAAVRVGLQQGRCVQQDRHQRHARQEGGVALVVGQQRQQQHPSNQLIVAAGSLGEKSRGPAGV